MLKELKNEAIRNLKRKASEVIIEHFTSKDMVELLNNWMMENNAKSFDGEFESPWEVVKVKASRRSKTWQEEYEYYLKDLKG